jgi:WD40 repeat protein
VKQDNNNTTTQHNLIYRSEVMNHSLSRPHVLNSDVHKSDHERGYFVNPQGGCTAFMLWDPALRYIYIVDYYKCVRQWDRRPYRPLRILNTYAHQIESALVTKDNKLITTERSPRSGPLNNNIRIIDTPTGKTEATYEAPCLSKVAAVTEDGDRLIIGSWSESHVLNRCTGKIEHVFSDHTKAVKAHCVHGDVLYSAGFDGIIRMHHLITGNLIGILLGHTGPIWRLALSKDGKTLVSGSSDINGDLVDSTCEMRIWDTASISCRYTIHCPGQWLSGLTESKNQDVISIKRDGTIVFRDLLTGEVKERLETPHQIGFTRLCCKEASVLATDQEVVYLANDRLMVWNRSEQKLTYQEQVTIKPPASVYSTREGFYLRQWNQNSWGEPGQVSFWSLKCGQCDHTIRFNSRLTNFVISSQGFWITTDFDKNLCVWQVNKGKKLQLAYLPMGTIVYGNIAIHDHRIAVIASRSLQILSLPNLQVLNQIVLEDDYSMQCLTLDNQHVMLGGYWTEGNTIIARTVRAWDYTNDYQESTWLTSHANFCAVTSNDTMLIAMDEAGGLHFYDKQTHHRSLLDLSYCGIASFPMPFQQRFCLLSEYGIVYVLTLNGYVVAVDIATQRVLQQFGDTCSGMISIGLSPDHRTLFTLCCNGEIRFYDLSECVHLGSFYCVDKGFLWTIPPDKYAPQGRFYTNREDLISVYEKTDSGQIIYLNPQDQHSKEYIQIHERPDMVMIRMTDLNEYQKLAQRHQNIVNTQHFHSHKALYASIKRALPGS